MSLNLIFSQYAFVRVGGKARILDKSDGSLMTTADFKSYCANLPSVVINKKHVAATKAWLESSNRETYTDLIFQPGEPQGPSGGPYNLWQGWGVEPNINGCCELFHTVLFDVICQGNEDNYHFELNKLAHMVQQPLEKPGVATVIQGEKGTGKSGIIRYLERMVGGSHTVHASRPSDLLGHFNAELATALLLNAEEATWAGDKAGEGTLKHLITEPRIRVERKGIDASMKPSYLRVFMTSNERWVVPASIGERRFHVLRANSTFRGNKRFWDAFHAEMTGTGPARLLYELLNHKIPADFNIHQPPLTEGLIEQIQQSLTPMNLWWQEVLQTGVLRLPISYGGITYSSIHSEDASRLPCKQDYADAFGLHQKQLRHGENGSVGMVGRFLNDLHKNHFTEKRVGPAGDRVRVWVFAELDVLREDFDQKVVPTEWQPLEPRLKLVEPVPTNKSLEDVLAEWGDV